MSAAAPNPEKLILLAAIGIGAYWILTHRALAAPVAPAQQGLSNPYTAANAANLVAKGIGALSSLFNGGTTPGTVDGQSASAWSVASTGANNPSAYVASSAVDGVAANVPGNSSIFDTYSDFGSSTGGDGAWL